MNSFVSAAGDIAAILFFAYVVGALFTVLCVSIVSNSLEKRPESSSRIRNWRLFRTVGAFLSNLLPTTEPGVRIQRAFDRGQPWQRRQGAKQTATFLLVGLTICGGLRAWGAYKRATQWYEIEPPPDISNGFDLNSPMRPDSKAFIAEWQYIGAFWTKSACLDSIRTDAAKAAGWRGAGASFVSSRRCVPAKTPYIQMPEEDDSSSQTDE
jgi:hypothetical protein